MANNITSNPLVIDTAGAGVIVTRTFSVWKIRWVAGSSAGHTCSVQDKNGLVKWASIVSGANYVEESNLTYLDRPLIFEGLLVPTLGSGTIYIYVASVVPI